MTFLPEWISSLFREPEPAPARLAWPFLDLLRSLDVPNEPLAEKTEEAFGCATVVRARELGLIVLTPSGTDCEFYVLTGRGRSTLKASKTAVLLKTGSRERSQ